MRLDKSIFSVNCRTILANFFWILLCAVTLLLICGDAELNPGPKKIKSCYNFSIFHWNIDSITAHNFVKISLLEACNAQHKFDMICISETYLDSSFPDDNPRFNLPGCNLVKVNNSCNT